MTGAGRLTVLVSGMVAGVPGHGGASWAVLQYVLGFRRLGHDVWLVEPVDGSGLRPAGATLETSSNATYFRRLTGEFGLDERAALLLTDPRETVGVPYRRLVEVAERADLLVNISGLLSDGELTGRVKMRLYLDVDPVFTQFWHATEGIDMGFGEHTHFATVGTAVGDPACPVPTCGLEWIPTVPPVVLEQWAAGAPMERDAFTTVGNWRSYGSVWDGNAFYGQKAHAFREFIELPSLTRTRFEVALSIHPDETGDLAALRERGWSLLDPDEAAGTPARYRRFIAGSKAELGIAKSGYVAPRCGWFSDRSVCYLASGRPVVAQDTGFSRHLPTGAGLLAFETYEEALAAIRAVELDYAIHSRAARGLAEAHFDSDRVLPSLLRRIGATN